MALTDEQIRIIAGTLPILPWGIGSQRCDAIAFARAIEKAAREAVLKELTGAFHESIRALLKEGS
jgi:hypothetical protein